MGAYDAPAGTVTLMEVAEALVTAAFTPPKYTKSFAAVGLKFVPVIVTADPTEPDVGLKEVTDGLLWVENLLIDEGALQPAAFVAHTRQ